MRCCQCMSVLSPNGNDVMDLVSAHSHDACAQKKNNDDHMPTPSSFILSLSLSLSISLSFSSPSPTAAVVKCICEIENKIQHHFFFSSFSFSISTVVDCSIERECVRVCTIVVIITISLYNIVCLARNNSFLVRLHSRFVFLPCKLKVFYFKRRELADIYCFFSLILFFRFFFFFISVIKFIYGC